MSRCLLGVIVLPDHGDFRSTSVNGHAQDRRACLKRANNGHPSHRYFDFANKPVFAPVKANFRHFADHLFDDTATKSLSFVRDWTARLRPA